MSICPPVPPKNNSPVQNLPVYSPSTTLRTLLLILFSITISIYIPTKPKNLIFLYFILHCIHHKILSKDVWTELQCNFVNVNVKKTERST